MTGTKERADLGFADALDDFDPAEWMPQALPVNDKPRRSETKKVAEAVGFRSREPRPVATVDPGPAPPAFSPSVTPAIPAPLPSQSRERVAMGTGTIPRRDPGRGRRTGRNAQFNVKARPETIAAFYAVADGHGWGLGETLERAVALLEREYDRGSMVSRNQQGDARDAGPHDIGADQREGLACS